MRMIYFIYCIYTKTLWDEPLPHCIEVAVHLFFGLPAPGTLRPPPSPLIYLIVFFSSVRVEQTNPLRATYTVSVQECYTLPYRQNIARHKNILLIIYVYVLYIYIYTQLCLIIHFYICSFVKCFGISNLLAQTMEQKRFERLNL